MEAEIPGGMWLVGLSRSAPLPLIMPTDFVQIGDS